MTNIVVRGMDGCVGSFSAKDTTPSPVWLTGTRIRRERRGGMARVLPTITPTYPEGTNDGS